MRRLDGEAAVEVGEAGPHGCGYFYTSVEEITSLYKALARWAMDAESVNQ